ncbi:DsrE family protein [Acidihalobacter yilgarnensis]|nr:DsrE family protein [Acidihalobacter yilgarnensis]
MKLTMPHRIVALFLSLFACAWLGTAQAAEQGPGSKLNDHAALAGLHEAKGLFLIDINDPNRVAHVLKVVGMTRKGLSEQGVKPHLIVVFVGPAVAFLTKDRRGIGYMQERAVSQVQHEIDGLAHEGVPVEACGIAMKGMDVSPKDLIPAVKPVGNGFISVIAYQAKGYSLVPVY